MVKERKFDTLSPGDLMTDHISLYLEADLSTISDQAVELQERCFQLLNQTKENFNSEQIAEFWFSMSELIDHVRSKMEFIPGWEDESE